MKMSANEMDETNETNIELTYDDLLQTNEELITRSTLVLQITEQQNKLTSDTFVLTENILSKLKRKEILRFRDKVSALNNEIKARLGFNDYWVRIVNAFNRKIYQNKVDFRKEDDECFSKLKNIIGEVKISLEEFELLIRLKKESNIEFYQDKIITLDEAKRDLEIDFPEDLKDFKSPLKKLINALEYWS
jgi:hypothetical protein